MSVPRDPTYREVARHVLKYEPEELLREVARLAAAESERRAQRGSLETPETPFAFAAVARTALAESRPGPPATGCPERSRTRSRRTRRRGAGRDQVRRLCDEMLSMWSPEVLAAGETDAGVLLAPIMFEQAQPQWSPIENLSRAYSLFVDAVKQHPDLWDAAAWVGELGVDLDAFMRTGFALHVAMLRNGGQIAREVLTASNVRPSGNHSVRNSCSRWWTITSRWVSTSTTASVARPNGRAGSGGLSTL